ncbi:MAG: lytic murein transglycosylase [Candidatus Nealsonbacteria bacterium]
MSGFKKYILFILILAVSSQAFLALAQLSPTAEREQLEEELKLLEEEILRYEQDISKTEGEKKSLQNEIYVLRQKVSMLNAQISQSNVVIKDLGLQIEDTEGSILNTGLKIDDSKLKLANILQSIYEKDQKSLLEILLTEAEISDFFEDLTALEALNSRSRDILNEIKALKVSLEDQKISLDGEKGELEKVVKLKTYQKQESQSTQKEKDYYLKLTEAEYQKQLETKKAAEQKAAEIRSRIFELVGIPEAPTFGEALEMAKYVESITGIRPAFLLAVLTQESNIGKNVGQCYLKDSKTGSGVVAHNGKTVQKVMSPSRDVPVFLEITQALGRDPYSTPVSCPMSYGWGGAMGPAQFIPSTWKIYRDEVKQITGRPADPWFIKDAFLASALYLTDYGAAKQDYNNEFNAALSYFAGPSWAKSSYKNVYKRDYGYPVMNIAERYQKDIEALEEAR